MVCPLKFTLVGIMVKTENSPLKKMVLCEKEECEWWVDKRESSRNREGSFNGYTGCAINLIAEK